MLQNREGITAPSPARSNRHASYGRYEDRQQRCTKASPASAVPRQRPRPRTTFPQYMDVREEKIEVEREENRRKQMFPRRWQRRRAMLCARPAQHRPSSAPPHGPARSKGYKFIPPCSIA